MLIVPRRQTNAMDSPHDHNNYFRRPIDTASRQYAIPSATPMPGHERRQSGGLSYAEHEMVRQRKTPHGRLFEQDTAAIDKGVQFPAFKHVLLSLSPEYRRTSSLPQQWPAPIQSQSYNPNMPGSDFARDGLYSQQSESYGASIPFTYAPAWDFPGGLDSMLNQTLPLQATQRYYVQHGTNVPTVLPTAFHSQFGPTASAGQELYGPYWPDGTYNPYRPASIRDSRVFPRAPVERFPLDHQVLDHHLLRKARRFPEGHGGAYVQNRPEQFLTAPTNYVQSPSSKWNHAPNAYHNSQHPYLQPYSGSAQSTHGPLSIGKPVLSPLVPGPRSDRIAFRDKAFASANASYTELLQSLRNSTRERRNSTQASSETSKVAKPAIFPRPPVRPGSHFQEDSSTKFTPAQDGSNLLGFRTGSQRPALDTPSRPQTAIFRPNQGYSHHDTTSFRAQPEANHTSTQQYRPEQRSVELRQFRETAIPSPNPRPPFYDPVAALQTMELLCHEAETPWVDGMLLAGCLAYGLGKYAKAEEWYRAVLRQDPGHVEAVSNLAATCHALNRREDALKYWSDAVSLRPSYFEAVEHLIGLLCTTHRAREAVSVIEYVENTLRIRDEDLQSIGGELSDTESDNRSHASSIATVASHDNSHYEFDTGLHSQLSPRADESRAPGFGSSGYAISGADNGRMLALIHAKGNMLYSLGNNHAAASAFEDAILIATGQRKRGIQGLINGILRACLSNIDDPEYVSLKLEGRDPILLAPEHAEATAKLMFPPEGGLPGLEHVSVPYAFNAAVATTSNSLLSLAKIYQDGMCNATHSGSLKSPSTREILALYYLSLSLQRSPSTANNVGILLASVQQTVHPAHLAEPVFANFASIPGVTEGSGIQLALMYYNYGLNLDPKHAHLYTNLGSLLKDIGQLGAAIKMYERAVSCDGNFDIALANLANAVKDQGRVADAIVYYRRAVAANPEFAEAVCGLATALNSVCSWHGRGGICAGDGLRDRLHVDDEGMKHKPSRPYGWINRVVEIVDKQLKDGETWGCGTLTPSIIDSLAAQLTLHRQSSTDNRRVQSLELVRQALRTWSGQKWEGSRVVRLVERAIREIGWQWYQDRYKHRKEYSNRKYYRPQLPSSLSAPTAPTVLPFHTFTAPLSAKQIRQISQRNALRISVCALRSAWLPATVFPPPAPPNPCLNVGYVSSDFNNHPLAHLMQSVFGLHDPTRVKAICYATTASDGSAHRQQIEREAPVFYDASSWSVQQLVNQIVRDNVHILVNLNGYTRGARNEVFAARPAPIHMSFMGFAGTLGAEWCDYVFADMISVPPETLSPWRRNVTIDDRLRPDSLVEDEEDWMYAENLIFARDTFFCVDHKQSAPDVGKGAPSLRDPFSRELAWKEEQDKRWKMRKELFPTLSDTAVILGNFNQLYKIDPATFDMYLQILKMVPNAILWLLRFPDLGEQKLLQYARDWASPEVASRIVFTDVAAKGTHIMRASVVDLFLDTPECNAHTTAADVIWSGTPILTWGKWKYKMCSRMAGSIVASALPEGREGDEARRHLLVNSEKEYIDAAIELAQGLEYPPAAASSPGSPSAGQKVGHGKGRLVDLRQMLWEGRWTSRLFDTKRWVRDVELAYWAAWEKWERGEGGDIWLRSVRR
ncbi:putative UDP-N-acetylglucosamine-peptide N-acetylglucosaminyltransferase SEC [Exophiala dermatitidis]